VNPTKKRRRAEVARADGVRTSPYRRQRAGPERFHVQRCYPPVIVPLYFAAGRGALPRSKHRLGRKATLRARRNHRETKT
jgi:hypothetical protein